MLREKREQGMIHRSFTKFVRIVIAVGCVLSLIGFSNAFAQPGDNKIRFVVVDGKTYPIKQFGEEKFNNLPYVVIQGISLWYGYAFGFTTIERYKEWLSVSHPYLLQHIKEGGAHSITLYDLCYDNNQGPTIPTSTTDLGTFNDKTSAIHSTGPVYTLFDFPNHQGSRKTFLGNVPLYGGTLCFVDAGLGWFNNKAASVKNSP